MDGSLRTSFADALASPIRQDQGATHAKAFPRHLHTTTDNTANKKKLASSFVWMRSEPGLSLSFAFSPPRPPRPAPGPPPVRPALEFRGFLIGS